MVHTDGAAAHLMVEVGKLVKYVRAMSYDHQEYLTAPARAYPGLGRLLLGCVAAVVLYLVLSILMFAGAGLLMGDEWMRPFVVPGEVMSPGQTLFALGSFIAMLLAVCVVTILLHHRSPLTLIGGLAPCLRDFRRVMVMLTPLALLFLAMAYATETLDLHTPVATWLILLPIALTLLFIQVTAEEVVFRGYLQSQIAASGAPPFFWISIPSILFGLGHYQAELFGPLAPYFVVWAIVFGLLAADLTARTGTLGAAIAFHFANNIVAILLVGLPDQLGGLALFTYPFSVQDTAEVAARLPIDAVGMALLYLAARVAIRR